mmetsp:Transcript_18752/g.47907  ORF Transcript_18752/g.47907 Transcript_18752/m.47907 type:complete len:90 (+) Transcript_18752:272-541(+)
MQRSNLSGRSARFASCGWLESRKHADHPDIHLTGWRNVQVDLSTHAIGGLSMPDLVLAAKIDAIPVEFSPKWLRDQQAAPKAPSASATQ